MISKGLAEQVVEFWLVNQYEGDEEKMVGEVGSSLEEMAEVVGQVIERYELDNSMGIFWLVLQIELIGVT